MLCLFNPEHDLCLANGGPHYVPPASALRFAREGTAIMQVLYPGAQVMPVAQADSAFIAAWIARQPEGHISAIVPWGWNAALAASLLKVGVPAQWLPSTATLAHWRQLQHRSTLLPLQPDSHAVQTPRQVEALLASHPRLVLKAPWSGSGRGLRWVDHALTPLDQQWMQKVVAAQQCVIAEPRRHVAADFALLYHIHHGQLRFVGYSLFNADRGVYRSNLLLPDSQIASRVGYTEAMRSHLESWLLAHIAPHYEGPLGVDHILDSEGHIHISELNLRHTMGLVAHQYLAAHPEAEGRALTLADSRLVLNPVV